MHMSQSHSINLLLLTGGFSPVPDDVPKDMPVPNAKPKISQSTAATLTCQVTKPSMCTFIGMDEDHLVAPRNSIIH